MTEKTGLYFGKFAPFHKGHQYMVETALTEVDHLYILIYNCPDTIDIPLSTRAEWIEELYPNTTVVRAWNGPTETGRTDHMKAIHEKYIVDRLPDDANITHFYSSEELYGHVSEALNAENRLVDSEREEVPISGTEIRDNPYNSREYVHPTVYQDLVTNVVFLGGPSTGKSTLAEELAGQFGTEWMPEYGREYWEKHNIDRRLTTTQLVELAEEHLEKEDRKLERSDTYLFTDTNAITTYCFSKYYHDEVAPRLRELAINCSERYDIVFLCGTDIPYDNTWDRSGEGNRIRLQTMTKDFLDAHNIPYITLEGSVEERVETVKSVLAKFEKDSWGDPSWFNVD